MHVQGSFQFICNDMELVDSGFQKERDEKN